MLAPLAAAPRAVRALLCWLSPLAALLLNIAALYLTLGFRQFSHYFTGIQAAIRDGDVDRARELLGAWRGESGRAPQPRGGDPARDRGEAIAASHRHVFAVLFWFVLLPGPSGAILYRMAAFLDAALGRQGRVRPLRARACCACSEWPRVRLTAAAFAVVGDFEDAVYCWRTQAAAWPDPNLGIVLAAGAGALGVKLGMPLTRGRGPAAARRAGPGRGGRRAAPRQRRRPAVARAGAVGVRAARAQWRGCSSSQRIF